MEHIFISSSAELTEVCTPLDNEPVFWAPTLLFIFLFISPEAERKKQHTRTKYIWEAIIASDLMCKMWTINHVVRVIDKLQWHAPGSSSATFNQTPHARDDQQQNIQIRLKNAAITSECRSIWGESHGAGELMWMLISLPCRLPASSRPSPACALRFTSAEQLFLWTDFCFYVIISVPAVLWTQAAGMCVVHSSCIRVEACTLCKSPSFQTPTGTQSPNQLMAREFNPLPLTNSWFLISNEHIYADFPLVSSFDVRRKC